MNSGSIQENTFSSGEQKIEWVDAVEPEKFDFDAGDELIGVLVSMTRGNVRDDKTGAPNPVIKYVVRHECGKEFFFHGTAKLNTLLRPTMRGHQIRIVCTGVDKSVTRNGNSMKTFKVQHSRTAAPGFTSGGTEITNDDIPF
jgi:hypothetical protein